MEIEVIKKLIEKHRSGHSELTEKSVIARKYYKNKNDILDRSKTTMGCNNPIRNADNRIASSFYSILVNQKAAYMFTAPPIFDTKDKTLNKKISDILGDHYPKVCKDLCINASNSTVAWLHVWKDQAVGTFKYAVVESTQVIPLWDSSLEKRLIAVLRIYKTTDDSGKTYDIYEYWDDTKCYAFRQRESNSVNELQPYMMFGSGTNSSYDSGNEYEHDFGEVPFIPFFNNNCCENDLANVKGLIDSYDKVYSGFTDDLEDIQEIVFLLSGYSGTNLNEFLGNIKKYKAIKLNEDDEDGAKTGVETLTIDIPVEARKEMLSMTRKAIFEQGQGIDPDPQNFGNSSGVALKYLYSLLELKAGLMETEFRLGFGKLIRLICKYLGCAPGQIVQTWTRTSVSNDTELAGIAKDSLGVISLKTIVKNHPWVENADDEMEQIKKEQLEQEARTDPYIKAFESPKDGDEKNDDEE